MRRRRPLRRRHFVGDAVVERSFLKHVLLALKLLQLQQQQPEHLRISAPASLDYTTDQSDQMLDIGEHQIDTGLFECAQALQQQRTARLGDRLDLAKLNAHDLAVQRNLAQPRQLRRYGGIECAVDCIVLPAASLQRGVADAGAVAESGWRGFKRDGKINRSAFKHVCFAQIFEQVKQ